MDVQLISNTNIDISPDLLDRVFETYAGPELRDWCHLVGLLEATKDFADKRQQGPPINVRTARTFIMNYYNGLQIPSNKFDDLETLPMIGKTGVSDPDWEKLKLEHPDIWSNQALQEAAKEFAQLAQAQKLSFDRKRKKIGKTSDIQMSLTTILLYLRGPLWQEFYSRIKHASNVTTR